MRISWAIAALAVLAPATLSAQANPDSLPARDAHEGFLVACDPYTDLARAQARLGKKNPLDVGILPLEVYLRNDTGKPIRLDIASIRLLVGSAEQEPQRLEPLALDDVIDAILNKKGPPALGSPRLPHPFPKASRSKSWQELEDRLGPLALASDLVGPGATVHGFLFFDLGRRLELVADARLYIPEVEIMTTHQPLLYFEVNLAPAARR